MTFATLAGARAGGVHTLRWLGAAALTLLAHAAVVWVVVNWRSATATPSEPPPAVTIDLSPVAPSSIAPEQDAADGPQMTEAAPSPSDEAAKKTIQAAAPDPTPLAPDAPAEAPPPKPPVVAEKPEAQREPPTPEPPTSAPAVQDLAVPQGLAQEAESPPPGAQQEPDAKPLVASPSAPEPPKPPDTAAAQEQPARPTPKAESPVTVTKAPELQKVKPKPPPPKTQVARVQGPKTEPENKRVVRTKSAKPDDRLEADRTRAPAGSAAPTAHAAASPSSSSGASLASTLATWKGELVAHINRFKRFPPNAASSGTASVAFAINRAGAVLSARLISSSGDRALDEEAVALLHRASPTPPPPAQMGGSVISLTVPIRFDR